MELVKLLNTWLKAFFLTMGILKKCHCSCPCQWSNHQYLYFFSYLPLPHVISGVAGGSGDNLTVASNTGAFISNDGRPSGSLPDLTNFHVNSHSPSPGPGATLAGESSNETCVNLTATVCSPNYSPVRMIFFIIISYLERTAIPKHW